MANFLTSSIGKKFIQSISGAFLIIFMLLHASINFFSVIDSFKGTYGAEDGLFKMGCDFMALPIVTVMVPVLALGFIVHILYGCYLTWQNIRARGGYNRYEVASKAAADSWSAKNMLVLGIVILGLLFFHLTHFWAKMQLAEFTGGEAADPYMLLNLTFGKLWVALCYIVWFIAIFLHMGHGFWSMFQTVGWSNTIWMKRTKVIGIIVAAVIVLMFISVVCNAYLQANGLIG